MAYRIFRIFHSFDYFIEVAHGKMQILKMFTFIYYKQFL